MTSPHAADVVTALVALGYSDAEIGDRLGVARSTARRWRRALGLRSRWTPPTPHHGTRARYLRGCRCTDCRAAHTAYQAAYRRRRAYAHWSAPPRQEVATH